MGETRFRIEQRFFYRTLPFLHHPHPPIPKTGQLFETEIETENGEIVFLYVTCRQLDLPARIYFRLFDVVG